MRELDFIPAWYPIARRKKRIVFLQGYATAILAAGLGLWVLFTQSNVRSYEGSLTHLAGEMDATRIKLARLDQLLELRKQLDDQTRIVSQLGQHIESSRLLNAIEGAMPKEMAIVEVQSSIDQINTPTAGLAGAKKLLEESDTPPDRRLKVSLTGVVPTDVDLANFLAGLSAIRFFDDVAMSYAKDRTDRGHVMREFEVTFTINLSQQVLAGAQ